MKSIIELKRESVAQIRAKADAIKAKGIMHSLLEYYGSLLRVVLLC